MTPQEALKLLYPDAVVDLDHGEVRLALALGVVDGDGADRYSDDGWLGPDERGEIRYVRATGCVMSLVDGVVVRRSATPDDIRTHIRTGWPHIRAAFDEGKLVPLPRNEQGVLGQLGRALTELERSL
jgi:hypothetical protein